MGCGGSQPVAKDQQVELCKNMLLRKVDTTRFVNDENSRAYNALHSSDIFGGSIFEPIGNSTRRGNLRHKRNSVAQDLSRVEINYLYGGGYYCIRNVASEDD